MLAHRGFQLLDESECRRLLASTTVGRIGLSIGALPAILPVNYVLDGESIVFRAATGTQIAESATRGVVAFEAGSIDPSGLGGWSVLAVGIPLEIDDLAIRMRLALCHSTAWTPRYEDHLFRLPLDLVSGTRIMTSTAGGHRDVA